MSDHGSVGFDLVKVSAAIDEIDGFGYDFRWGVFFSTARSYVICEKQSSKKRISLGARVILDVFVKESGTIPVNLGSERLGLRLFRWAEC